jgi:superfamily II DNA/RNA helicase
MTYVHRIGRTGRAGRTGVAVTFVDWRDMHRWKLINDALNLGKPEPEETYSTSEHLYTQLDIPREATGTLPRAMRAREGLAAEALEDIGETGKIRSASPGRTRDAAPSGSGRSGARSRDGQSRGGQARGGSGQARKSSAAAVREDGGLSAGGPSAGGPSAGGAARPRRRRRTRGGHDLGPGQQAPGQAGAGQAGQATAAGAGQGGQAGAGQIGAGGQAAGAGGQELDGGQPTKQIRRRRRPARAENSSEETRKAS